MSNKQPSEFPYPICVDCWQCQFLRGCNPHTGLVKKCEQCGDDEYQLDPEVTR